LGKKATKDPDYAKLEGDATPFAAAPRLIVNTRSNVKPEHVHSFDILVECQSFDWKRCKCGAWSEQKYGKPGKPE
jgi:hypothetical protein